MATPTTAAKGRPTAAAAKSEDDLDIDTFLRTESTVFHQNIELTRLLTLSRTSTALNPLEVLDLPSSIYTTPTPATATTDPIDAKLVKQQYRKKSLLLHPDKCKLADADKGFEMLKKAETELSDPGKRAWLSALVGEARQTVFRRRKLVRIPHEDAAAMKELAAQIQLEVRRLLTDEGQRDSVRLKNEVERKAAEQAAMAEEKKRKAEEDKVWEETRDGRVDSWRVFLKKGAAVKKRKREAESRKNGLLG
ncbi:hypothetical protein DFJ73DRAFT_827409 [Zopfochytrium polystomum]|nr:hypothetical protein DFJ73DRAFT_827409 [Zopfochytrium polystomum]